MSSMASENFNGSRINNPGCSGSEDRMKSSPSRRRGSGPGTSPLSHELLHHRQPYGARFIAGSEHGLSRFHVVRWFRKEDTGHVGLRVPVIQREPAGLDLHHDSMSWLEHVVGGRKSEAIFLRFTGRDGGRMLEALAVTAAKNVHGNR